MPQFAFAGNEPLSDVEKYNYTRALWPDARMEYGLVAQHMLKEDPDVKVGILGINTDFTESVIPASRRASATRRTSWWPSSGTSRPPRT